MIVEDGTGLANSDSYVSLTEAGAYHSAMGHVTWEAPLKDREAALIAATRYVDTRWAQQFRGVRASATQALEWPRTGAHNARGDALTLVPAQLKRAVYEYALRQLTAPLLPDPAVQEGQVLSKRERVGALETDTQYGGQRQWPIYPAADRQLWEVITSAGTTLVRA